MREREAGRRFQNSSRCGNLLVRLVTTGFVSLSSAGPYQEHGVWHRKWKWSCSVVSDSATPWSVAYQAPPSMGFSRQQYWCGLPQTSLSKKKKKKPIEYKKENPNLRILLLSRVGWGGKREGDSRTYVYLWRIHVDVWPKLTQYCNSIRLQLKINITKRILLLDFPGGPVVPANAGDTGWIPGLGRFHMMHSN